MCVDVVACLDISIHALRKESDGKSRLHALIDRSISIHALRKESDILRKFLIARHLISIHALRKESDPCATRYRPR